MLIASLLRLLLLSLLELRRQLLHLRTGTLAHHLANAEATSLTGAPTGALRLMREGSSSSGGVNCSLSPPRDKLNRKYTLPLCVHQPDALVQ